MDDLIVQSLRLHRSTLGLEEKELLRIAEHARLENVPAGQVVHQAGEAAANLLLLVNGRLALVVRALDGSEQPIRCLGPGSQFGLLGILHEIALPVSLVAETDACVIRISGPETSRLMAELPLWKRRLVDSMGGQQAAGIASQSHHPRLVGLLHFSPDSRRVARSLVNRLEQFNESTVIFTDAPSDFAGIASTVHSVLDEKEELLPREEIRGKITTALGHDRVVLSFDIARAGPYLSRLCEGCDRVYWFVKPGDSESIERLIAKVVAEDTSVVSNMRWVWCLGVDESVAPLRQCITSLVDRDIKIQLWEDEKELNRVEQRGFSHLVHDLRNVRLGIALSGGAARGMAHLGVLQVIEEAGIFVDLISGTSVGAMVGVMYAAGIPPTEAAKYFARDLTPSLLAQKIPGGRLLYLIRKYRRRHWDSMLRPYLHDWHLQQLPTPVSCVSVDLVSGRQHVQDQGDAVRSILGSINLPGIAPPICRDGMALVDGGVLNNLPADVLIAQRADFVIAVDVGSHLPVEFSGIRPETPSEKIRVPNVLGTLTRAIGVQNAQMNSLGAQPADFRIEPDVSAFSAADFRRAVEFADVGRAATEQVVAELRSQLLKRDPCLVEGGQSSKGS